MRSVDGDNITDHDESWDKDGERGEEGVFKAQHRLSIVSTWESGDGVVFVGPSSMSVCPRNGSDQSILLLPL